MGIIYIRNKHYLKAALQFIKATQLDKYFILGSNTFIAYYHLGAVYEMIGQTENAVTFYQKCGDYILAKERLALIKQTSDPT